METKTTVCITPTPSSIRTQVHDSVSHAASVHGAAQHSSLNNGVSIHRMPESVSFASTRKILAACAEHDHKLNIGTVDGVMVLSLNFNTMAGGSSILSSAKPFQPKKRKRQRDPDDEAAQNAVGRVKKGLHDGSILTESALNSAHAAVCGLLKMKGAGEGESVVESYGLSFKAPEASGGNGDGGGGRPRLILSARLAPGTAVSLKALFKALGSTCCEDGMLTVQDSSTLADGFNLPLSEQARVAVVHGQRAISLFATVS